MTSLNVAEVRGVAWVQDGGRRGFAHHGVPPGGAVCPERLALANRAVGNAWDAPAVEFWGTLTVKPAGPSPVRLFDGRTAREVTADEAIPCGGEGAPSGVRYVAVRGGVEVPVALGGRGTLPVARLGGHEGRALRPGDVLPVGAGPAPQSGAALPALELDRPLRVLPGPEASEGFAALLQARFTLSPTSDRTGSRLQGELLPAPSQSYPSAPMVRGAIQVPPGGEPVILGPDHPTTGGYPVVAVLARADHGRLGALVPGVRVSFEQIELAAARLAWRAHRSAWFK